MEPITTSVFAMGVFSGIIANYGTDVISKLVKSAVEIKPELQSSLDNAQSLSDIEKIFEEAVGVIDANAGTGTLALSGADLEAVKGIRFDHSGGFVTIGDTKIKSSVLVTGGGAGATGQTHITGNTSLSSHGTSIKVGAGCSIKITGGATIKQS